MFSILYILDSNLAYSSISGLDNKIRYISDLKIIKEKKSINKVLYIKINFNFFNIFSIDIDLFLGYKVIIIIL
jgi:hypothetical protein